MFFVLGCSSVNKFHQTKHDVSLQGADTSPYNQYFNYYGKGSINYRGELIIFLFRWINRENIISLVIKDPFEMNEILITLDGENVSMNLKKISWGRFQIHIESFKDNSLSRKALKEVLLWINKSIYSEFANKSEDYSCQKTIKKLYWQGQIDGCSRSSKKINLQRKDLNINLFFFRQNGEN